MAIIPVNQLPKEEVDTKPVNKSTVIPINDLPEDMNTTTPANSKKIFRDSLKQSLRNVMGQATSEFIPGLESDLILQGVDAGNKFGKEITNSLGVPSKPNLPINFGGLKGNINPNSVTSTLLGGALDPRSIASGIALSGPGQAIERAAITATRPGYLMKGSRNAIKEAEKLTTQILQPTTSELSEAIMTGKQLPSIKRGAENIVASKTFEDVVKSIKNTTKELFDERNLILNEHNVEVGNEALESLSNAAKKASKEMVLSPGKMKQFDNVFFREAQFLEQNPNMDIVTAQARKEALQKLTKPLLDKRKAQTLTGAENVELQAYDALRAGYREAILKALPKDKAKLVDRINSKYEGLLDATELASDQAARGIKEVPKTLLEKVASSFGLSPKFTAFRLATKELAGVAGKTRLERTTSKIMELRNKSETLRQLAHLARKVKS